MKNFKMLKRLSYVTEVADELNQINQGFPYVCLAQKKKRRKEGMYTKYSLPDPNPSQSVSGGLRYLHVSWIATLVERVVAFVFAFILIFC